LLRFRCSPRGVRALSLPVLTLFALTGCTAAGQGTPAPSSTSTMSSIQHIHGLGADPLTGDTYAATHQGMWLIPTKTLPPSYLEGAPRSTTDEPVQIGGREQDVMGFTVAAPGLLLASGHPAPTEQNDWNLPNLGLISSTDGADSWTPVALQGETDFHDLAAVPMADGMRVYGYDAGAGSVSVSDDSGATWSARAVLPLRDLAVDPARPDRVFATTAEGLTMSDDAGRTFGLVPGAPGLLVVEAVDAAWGAGLVGIDPAGAVWRQEGLAEAWTQTGTIRGTPEAFTFVGGGSPWILVADDHGIAASADYGVTWTDLVTAPSE